MRGFCQRCGFRRTDLRKEWTALIVCGPCWDAKPADLKPPYIDPNEGAPHKLTAPEPEDHVVEVGENGAEDL
jgi:hypothetical protein